MKRNTGAFVWITLIAVVLIPLIAAATSPLLEWRDPIYIVAGFSGVVAMALLLFQPLLAAAFLPGISAIQGKRFHRWVGLAVALSLTLHVIGLWITSPPDMIDALLFASPTPFSIWGVVAMWAVIGTIILALFRRQLRLRPPIWKLLHKTLAVIIVFGSVLHAVLIDGTMEFISKLLLCGAVVLAVVLSLFKVKT